MFPISFIFIIFVSIFAIMLFAEGLVGFLASYICIFVLCLYVYNAEICVYMFIMLRYVYNAD